jgi:tryptophanyl-tRNA synthetase
MVEEFAPFRERRSELSRADVNAVLEEGSEKARAVARQTISEVRQAIGLPPSPRA